MDRAHASPPLKWAGGKRWQLPHLAPLWRKYSHCRLVEPFCGGLAVSLGLAPEHALLNDINVHLINFYTWIQRGLSIEVDMENDRGTYLRNRELFNQLDLSSGHDSALAASLFYYLNRTGFNGLCRFNRAGKFNVPFGAYKKIAYRTAFDEIQAAIAGWRFSAQDFESIATTSSDFVYADPPYDVDFTRYASTPFSWNDQVRLARWLASLAGPVVVSNQATSRIVDLYRSLGFAIEFLVAPRSISSSGDRTPVREVLAVRNL